MKGAMSTNRGYFEPKVMYFRMTNSPATFQTLIELSLCRSYCKGRVAVYMDDILIYTEDLKHHRKIVQEVLADYSEYDLYLKPEKGDFEKQEMEYLELIHYPGEVRMTLERSMQLEIGPLLNIKDVRGFIGFFQFL